MLSNAILDDKTTKHEFDPADIGSSEAPKLKQ